MIITIKYADGTKEISHSPNESEAMKRFSMAILNFYNHHDPKIKSPPIEVWLTLELPHSKKLIPKLIATLDVSWKRRF